MIKEQILGHTILSPDEFIAHIRNFGLFSGKEEEIIQENVNACLLDLRRDWQSKLSERGETIIPYPPAPALIDLPSLPEIGNQTRKEYLESAEYLAYLQEADAVNLQNKTNLDNHNAEKYAIDLQFAELVFSQPDYKSRAQREAKSDAELLQEAKERKIQELETAYRAAQWIQVKNGHTFFVPLAGSDWVTIETACYSAHMRGMADLIWRDIDGNIQTLRDLPLTEWQKFYFVAKPIGVSNKDIRERREDDIKNCQSQEELDLISWTFPAITEVVVDL